MLLLSCTFSFLFSLSLFFLSESFGKPEYYDLTQSHDTGAPCRLRLCATASSTRLISFVTELSSLLRHNRHEVILYVLEDDSKRLVTEMKAMIP